MAEVIIYSGNSIEKRKFSSTLIDKTGVKLWVDVENCKEKEIKEILENFGIHPLVVEDCVHERSRPRIESFNNYLHLVIFSIDEKLNVKQINVILGKKFIITIHKDKVKSIDELKRDNDKLKRSFSSSVSFILYSIFDAEVDSIFPVVDKIGDKLDRLEGEVLKSNSAELVHRLFRIKTSLIYLRKITVPEREIISKLKSFDKIVDPRTNSYFNDIYDHLMWINDMIENYRETVSGITEVHLSLVSNKMNEVMKVLTVIATIFIPLTFITGIYGMNFDYMPELRWSSSYFIVLGFMALIFFMMLLYFKRKEWL